MFTPHVHQDVGIFRHDFPLTPGRTALNRLRIRAICPPSFSCPINRLPTSWLLMAFGHLKRMWSCQWSEDADSASQMAAHVRLYLHLLGSWQVSLVSNCLHTCSDKMHLQIMGHAIESPPILIPPQPAMAWAWESPMPTAYRGMKMPDTF